MLPLPLRVRAPTPLMTPGMVVEFPVVMAVLLPSTKALLMVKPAPLLLVITGPVAPLLVNSNWPPYNVKPPLVTVRTFSAKGVMAVKLFDEL